ncbi:MAG: DUF5596 domain-containing protein [Clostridia bacterium]|nr:DUF5596 domain-containing protein [Clostridia bacterium]
MMREYLIDFFKMQDYPAEAAEALLSDYEKLMAVEECRALFEKYLSEYEEKDKTNFGEFIVLAAKAGNAAFVDGRSTQFICFLCAGKHLREMYVKNGLPLDVYFDTMRDMKYKLMECYKMHGVWGSFVASWFYGAFVLDRFEIGRLQYEFSTHFATQGNLNVCGVELTPESPVINLHIPSSGPLTQESVDDSLSRAYKFMKKYYPRFIHDGKMVVECGSWLLFKDHEKFLPEKSNIRRFMENFDIVHYWYDDNFGDCWRVFNKDWTGDASVLPRDTALQRAYADWLSEGNKAGEGHGILVYNGEKIINRK